MRVLIDNVELTAKPQDVAELIKLLSVDKKTKKIPIQSAEPAVEQTIANLPAIEDTVKQSQELRQKLQEDPNYNPHAGVVASKEPTPGDIIKANTERAYTSDLEPGVSSGY